MTQHIVVLNVAYTTKPGSAPLYVRALDQAGILTQIRAEAGCIQYEFFQGLDNPDHLLLVERWDSQEALSAHAAQPFMKQLMEIKDQYILETKFDKFHAQQSDRAF